MRWHWFGDPVNGVATWNPHVNVLVDGGYLAAGELEIIKAELRKALRCPDLIVNYSYSSSPKKMWHMLKYVTRATFLEKYWDERMADQVRGFRNIRYWGRWQDKPAWSLPAEDKLDALVKLEKSICPDCDEPITWGKPWPIAYLELAGVTGEILGGYFRLADLPPPSSY